MITLITGTPGAGKTLYCISKLLRDLVGSVVNSTDDSGNHMLVRRRILTNIPGLLLDHEFIGPDVGGGLADWHLWAKPGDVIVYDEVQRSWPPRANGSKVPDYISALETHRHMGVDFIILTQHPMLLDRNVAALTGRHLHVRRFGGIGAAIVYEWDHCSRSLLYSKSLKKFPFKYDKSIFKLYKSAELHTKPKTSIPTLAFVVIGAIAAALYLIPLTVSRIAAKGEQVKPAVKQESSPAPGGPGSSDVPPGGGIRPMASANGQSFGSYDWSSFVPRVSYEPRSAPAYDHLRQVVSMPRVVGGYCKSGDCVCYSQQAVAVLWGRDCAQWMFAPRFDPYRHDRPEVMAQADPPSSISER